MNKNAKFAIGVVVWAIGTTLSALCIIDDWMKG